MPIGDYSGGSTSSSSSSNSGGGDRDTGSDYGQFDRAVSQAANNPPSAPSGGDGGNNTVDPGFQEALRQQAIQQLALGDPDPEESFYQKIEIALQVFWDNYSAAVQSNPLNLGTIGALKTLYQTDQARDMMAGLPGYGFLESSGGGNVTDTGGGGGEQAFINKCNISITLCYDRNNTSRFYGQSIL